MLFLLEKRPPAFHCSMILTTASICLVTLHVYARSSLDHLVGRLWPAGCMFDVPVLDSSCDCGLTGGRTNGRHVLNTTQVCVICLCRSLSQLKMFKIKFFLIFLLLISNRLRLLLFCSFAKIWKHDFPMNCRDLQLCPSCRGKKI